jgi:hypothetical protein
MNTNHGKSFWRDHGTQNRILLFALSDRLHQHIPIAIIVTGHALILPFRLLDEKGLPILTCVSIVWISLPGYQTPSAGLTSGQW